MTEPSKTLTEIQENPMTVFQWSIVFLCTLLIALDGYDVLAIAFAAPGMMEEWGLSKAALGVILPLELVGMGLGSIGLGNFADRHGRRNTLLIGLFIITIGMLISGIAPNIYILGAARVFTGIGIGGMIVAATALVADFCNNKNKSLAIVLMAAGFPLGIYIGASFLAPLLEKFDWRVTFYLGAGLGGILLPVASFGLPESLSFLETKRPKDALERMTRIMKRMGRTSPLELPPLAPDAKTGVTPADLFKPGLAFVTISLTIAYLGNIATYYYFVKWLPTLVTEIGYSASQASQVLGIISLGGVVGSVGVGILARLISIQNLMIFGLIAAAIGVCLFPSMGGSLANMKAMGFLTGALLFAAVSGFYALFARFFPSSVLGSGSGLVVGLGRGGAILGPMLPGFLFAAGLGIHSVAIIMALGSFVGGISVLILSLRR